MTERTQKLLDEVMALPNEERLDFIERLMVSQRHEYHGIATPEIAEEWDAEIARRLEDVDSGKVKAIPWEEVRRRMSGTDSHDNVG